MATNIVSSPELILTEKDVAEVASELVEAQNHSHHLGLNLGLQPYEVDGICKMHPNPMDQLTEVIVCFTRRAEPKPTWRLIVSALKSPMVNLTALAEKIKAKYPSSLSSSTSSTKTAESSRKRKSEQSPPEPVKVLKKEFNFGGEVYSTHCSEREVIVKGAVTVHDGKVYFASGSSIHVLNATHKKPHWLPKIDINRKYFGLTTINDMLVAVGGNVDGTIVPSVQCYAINDLAEQSKWEEKYPNMAVARLDPEVVRSENYVIVIAGWTKDHYFAARCAELSVEILSLKEMQWHSIDGMKLPDYMNSMVSMSACVCNDIVYLTTKHNDAHYYQNSAPEEDDSDEEDNHRADPYKCFTFFQCFINDFTQMNSFKWHTLSHPHSVTFSVSNEAIAHSDDCMFSLLCIGDSLLAIGCDHIEAVTPDYLQKSLKHFYKRYAIIDYMTVFTQEGSRRIIPAEPHCAIHLYDPERDTWKQIHKIDDFGLTSAQPLLAVVHNRLVIVRSTTNACILHFE